MPKKRCYSFLTWPQWRLRCWRRESAVVAACRRSAGRQGWRHALFHQHSHRKSSPQRETSKGTRPSTRQDTAGVSGHLKFHPVQIRQPSCLSAWNDKGHRKLQCGINASLLEYFQTHPVLVLVPDTNPSLILWQKAATQPIHLLHSWALTVSNKTGGLNAVKTTSHLTQDKRAQTGQALTCRSTHFSSILLLLNSHRRPEEVMQKVESDIAPRPQATSQKKLFLSSPSSPERPSRGTGALA